MKLRRANKLYHIELLQATRELDFCNFDSKYKSSKEYKRLN